jgi:hypothetical protein
MNCLGVKPGSPWCKVSVLPLTPLAHRHSVQLREACLSGRKSWIKMLLVVPNSRVPVLWSGDLWWNHLSMILWWWFYSQLSPAEAKRFSLYPVSRPALGPTQLPVQWVPGVLSPKLKSGRGVTLTTHPHIVPKWRMCRSYISSPPKRLHGV